MCYIVTHPAHTGAFLDGNEFIRRIKLSNVWSITAVSPFFLSFVFASLQRAIIAPPERRECVLDRDTMFVLLPMRLVDKK